MFLWVPPVDGPHGLIELDGGQIEVQQYGPPKEKWPKPQVIHIYRRRFWWSAQNPDEPVGTCDAPTTIRSFTRMGLIAKATKRWKTKPRDYEIVEI